MGAPRANLALRRASIAYRRWLARSWEASVAWRVSQSQYFNHFRMAPAGRFNVSIPRTFIQASVALALTSVVFTTSAFGQSPAATPNRTAAVSEPKPGSAENRVATESGKPKDLLS